MDLIINKQPTETTNVTAKENQSGIENEKVISNRANFPKGLRGGGPCFDCLACLCCCCAIEEIACFECCKDC